MYVDTSTLFAIYIAEEKSKIAEKAIQKADQVHVSSLTDVEFYSALKKRNKIGQISLSDLNKTYSLYRSHRKDQLYKFITLNNSDFKSAEFLLQKTSTPLRTLDALHLGIVENQQLPLFTFDQILKDAAQEFGISVVDYSG